jgi:chromosomal replication initiation ATPase DnaA
VSTTTTTVNDPKTVLLEVAQVVSKHTGVPAADIIKRGRLGNVVIARFIAIEMLIELLPLLPIPVLAKLFDRTVGWARFAVEQKIVDARFKKIKQTIRHELHQSTR